LHEHFGLSEPGELEPSWFDSEPDMTMQNLFVGRIRVFKLGFHHKLRLINPNSLLWNRAELAEIDNDNVNPELVRNTIVDELGTMLLARWRRADIGNALLMEYNYLEQRLIELGAAMAGVADGAISVVSGIVDIAVLLYKGVKAWIEFNIRMVKASYEFIADLSMEDVRAIGENVRNLVGEVITTAQEIKDKIILGAKIFNAAMSDGLVREAIVQYMDGYTESVSHIQNINNIAKFVGAAVGEILLFLAFAPGQLAKLAAQGTVMIGRFSIKLIQLISRLGRAILARAEQAARAVKHTVEVIPEKLGEAARKVGDAVESALRRDVGPSGNKASFTRFSGDYDTHITVRDFDVPRKRGIGGAHNSEEFFKYSNEFHVVESIPHPTVEGVQKIRYQMAALDRAGNPTGDFKAKVFEKTVYDPKVISDSKMLQWGREAAAQAQTAGPLNREWVGVSANGIQYRGYLDETGAVRSFFPDF
jgi:hypothetical protein